MLRRLSCTCSRALPRSTYPSSKAPTSPVRSHSTSSPSSPAPSTPPERPREDPRWPGWTPTIGLELHVQLKGAPKLFSPARAVYDAEPNMHVARFDAALPGSLPVLNPLPLRLALLCSLSLSCDTINLASRFDRKHYFYPDLPSGFQITQKYSPLARDGVVRVLLEPPTSSSKKKKKSSTSAPSFVDVRIEQVQLEQDTAKSFHSDSGTLIDLNRAGCALVEIVTKPDMSTPEEAGGFVKTLQSLLRHSGVSAAGMDKGELRCDVNVSVARTSSTTPGTRCEVKNLNGVRFVQGAIEAEIARQIEDLEAGETIRQATRGYDAVEHRTFHLRGKEDAVDYRYMPDPELGVARVTEQQLASLAASLPELPVAALARLQSQYGLSARDAGILVALGEGAESEEGEVGEVEGGAAVGVRWFEEVVAAPGLAVEGGDLTGEGRAKQAANWLIHELLGQLAKARPLPLPLAHCPIKPAELAELIDAVKQSRLTGTNAKQLLRDYISSPSTPTSSFSSVLLPALSAAPSPASNSSSSDLSSLVSTVIAALPVEAEKVRNGQVKVLMRLVGEAMKRSGGKADAKGVKEELERQLGVGEGEDGGR